jgi:DHA1 family bicyclomycin/chloramphenicol resistance-like MFS transporter
MNTSDKPSVTPPPPWLLTFVTFSGTLALHIFVPAHPAAAADLGASPAAMQMSISLYILGLVFVQLIYGPVSDGIARRPTLIAGLALYATAGGICALAPNVDVLLGGRLAQAIAGCASLLLGRAMVRDISDSGNAVKRLSTLALMLMISPGPAPIIGAA